MCATSISAGENVDMIIYSGCEPSTVSRTGVHATGPNVVESHVMFVSRRWGIRSHDCQGVLAVLQQGSPVNDAKPSPRSSFND